MALSCFMDIAKPEEIEKEKYRDSDSNLIEGKMDGSRMVMISNGEQIQLRNKRGNEKTELYPEFKDLNIPECILDGEMIVKDEKHPHGNFRKLLKRDSGNWNFKKKMLYKKNKATFVAFDVLEWKGENYRSVPLRERREQLERICEDLEAQIELPVVFDKLDRAWDWVTGEVDGIEKEGLVVKKLGTTYPHGRTRDWRKIKYTKDVVREVKNYEKHSKGIRVETEEEKQGITINGHKAEEVKEIIEDRGSAKIEVTCLEEKEDALRQGVFNRVVT